jgi:hypothetical protein
MGPMRPMGLMGIHGTGNGTGGFLMAPCEA